MPDGFGYIAHNLEGCGISFSVRDSGFVKISPKVYDETPRLLRNDQHVMALMNLVGGLTHIFGEDIFNIYQSEYEIDQDVIEAASPLIGSFLESPEEFTHRQTLVRTSGYQKIADPNYISIRARQIRDESRYSPVTEMSKANKNVYGFIQAASAFLGSTMSPTFEFNKKLNLDPLINNFKTLLTNIYF